MTPKDQRPKARLPRGFADRSPADIRASEEMIARIRRVYERYGFMAVETPMVEYTDALGKFLPDQDRPNEGVFSFQDDDGDWLSLRYDLTAPLARYVAENYERLPKPYRSYRFGWVFRNEKPGPGRFRQFMQFDADTVGAASPAADAEMCMMAADALEEVGIPRGDYVIKVSSRKVLDGVMEANGITHPRQKLAVLRAIDKLDRLGFEGVRQLLGEGRTDQSGDRTAGAGLTPQANTSILNFVTTLRLADNPQLFELMFKSQGIPEKFWREILETADESIKKDMTIVREQITARTQAKGLGLTPDRVNRLLDYFTDPRHYAETTDSVAMFQLGTKRFVPDYFFMLSKWKQLVANSGVGVQGVDELQTLADLVSAAGYRDRIDITSAVVRGLEYYTGPVFEAELLLRIPNEKGEPVVFGSVGGGGRYDGLVGRFLGEDVPATGFSVGVSRLQAALAALGKLGAGEETGPVVVLVLDRDRIADYQAMVARLRAAQIAAEMYLGESGLKAQMKYADRRNAPLAVIQGSDEKARGVIQIKDLALGKELAAAVADNREWREERPGQQEVREDQLVEAVRRMLSPSQPRPR
jgi:histidyl-tRNA synthetase